MTYRAPVAEMVFAMRHVGGLDRALAEGLYGDLSLDWPRPCSSRPAPLRAR